MTAASIRMNETSQATSLGICSMNNDSLTIGKDRGTDAACAPRHLGATVGSRQ